VEETKWSCLSAAGGVPCGRGQGGGAPPEESAAQRARRVCAGPTHPRVCADGVRRESHPASAPWSSCSLDPAAREESSCGACGCSRGVDPEPFLFSFSGPPPLRSLSVRRRPHAMMLNRGPLLTVRAWPQWGLYRIGKWPAKLPPPDHQTAEPRSQNVVLNGCQAETVVGLPWAADSCPWVGKLRTVLPLSDVIRDSGRSGGGRALGFPAQSVATPHAARGRARPHCGHSKIRPCCCLGCAFEMAAFTNPNPSSSGLLRRSLCWWRRCTMAPPQGEPVRRAPTAPTVAAEACARR
jgi:hypothetical protein